MSAFLSWGILLAAQHVFFCIATEEDVCGKIIGQVLHLTQQPYAWWAEKFKERNCTIHYSHEGPDHCIFYVSAWRDGEEIVDAGVLNTGEEQIKANVRANCSNGWQQVSPCIQNDLECMILGGGPSLTLFKQDIWNKRQEGVKLLTLNGAYNWCLEQVPKLIPSAQIIVDARPFNKRFVQPVVDGCKYLISSQCDPCVLEGLPKDRTYLWHPSAECIQPILKEEYEHFWPVPGGSSVLLRAIPLMRMLGYRKFHLYGCDSCLMDDQHHAYSQPENDGVTAINVAVTGGRIFRCVPWMLAQAQEMLTLIKLMGDEVDLAIYGDGLLAHLLTAAARIEEEQPMKEGEL